MAELTTEEISHLRWQGEVSQHMKEQARRMEGMNTRQTTVESRLNEMGVELAAIRTKVGFYSGLGALVGGGIVAFISGHIGA